MLVSIDDIKNRWISNENLPADEKINVLIEDFESQILNRFPDFLERIASGKLSQNFVVSTISRWVIEYLQTSGTPYQSETQTMYGVGSRSITVGSGSRVSRVLSEADLRLFLPKKKQSILSINMNTGYRSQPLRYIVD